MLNRYNASRIEKENKMEHIHFNNIFTCIYSQHNYIHMYTCAESICC